MMDEGEERDRLQRIRRRAYRLWEEEGRPEGRADVHWDQATELVAIEDNYRLATAPVPSAEDFGPTGEPVEPIAAVENLGEFPTMTDQGEEQTYPSRRTAPSQRTAMPEPQRPAGPKSVAPSAAAVGRSNKPRRAAAKKRNDETKDKDR